MTANAQTIPLRNIATIQQQMLDNQRRAMNQNENQEAGK